ncbi:glutamate racemase [Undibacterium sp. 5I1]|uniref:glutamate racemase n=1 Tax=unclassified Undibacterium TaxID=2630295 RepID=UPI002AB42427|nr:MULTISPECIES: glutamate racemase [unclassified Undibacterium]MDY7537726.1 glutamate racemase [Undibacterium sp. 5I1]MEB0230218.1 glutamate racemase [Undibacterium sp. 10I3]MEB0256463.1 glutamate racemase [Undibacterium sp. 5I1]
MIVKIDAAIGVFDSGIGGLSVLQHIRKDLPHEHVIYFADSGFAPYGDKPESLIVERSLAVAQFLTEHSCKALVVACNTATAAAIKALRQAYPDLNLVGVEPGLKPAAQQSQNGIVGVLATQATLQSEKFTALRDQLSAETGVQFFSQACVGLVNQIEKAELHSAETVRLLHQYLTPLLQQGADTIVLGCTHYPFVAELILKIIAEFKTGNPQPSVKLIDTGKAVSKQLTRLLASSKHATETVSDSKAASDTKTASGSKSHSIVDAATKLIVYTTGSSTTLAYALDRLLHIKEKDREIMHLSVSSKLAKVN